MWLNLVEISYWDLKQKFPISVFEKQLRYFHLWEGGEHYRGKCYCLFFKSSEDLSISFSHLDTHKTIIEIIPLDTHQTIIEIIWWEILEFRLWSLTFDCRIQAKFETPSFESDAFMRQFQDSDSTRVFMKRFVLYLICV